MAQRGLGSVALGAWLLTACTAVLGMERAELSEDGGAGAGVGGTTSGGTSGVGGSTPERPRTEYPAAACDVPDPACQGCLMGCGLDNCLSSQPCREAVNKHMNCLDETAGCGDSTNCAGKYLDISDPATYAIGQCLTDTCFDDCQGKIQTIASTCELYCKCMEQRCSDFMADIAPCLDTCAGLDLNRVYCRLQHCEAATPADQTHCEHALGQRDHCPRSSPGNQCRDKIHSGFPCRGVATDCCSGICPGGSVCQ